MSKLQQNGIEITALQMEKRRDQEGRKINVQISKADAVERKREFERRGQNDIAREPVEAGRGRKQKK